MFDSDYDSDFAASDIEDSSNSSDISDSSSDENVELLDTSDLTDNMSETEDAEDDLYHATRMSDEEVQRIDDMWKEEKSMEDDIEPYKATRLSDADDLTEDSDDVSGENVLQSESLEDAFAADVEAMSFDDLYKEQERIDKLSKMDDMDIFVEYDNAQREKYDPELFSALTDGMPKEVLEQLKNGLATGDPDTYDYFGLSGDGDNESSEEYSRARSK